MRIWLITVGEPLPINHNTDRLYRTGILANILSKRGHQVVWWTSTFDHARKRQWFNTDRTVNNNNFEIKLLYANSYNKNISISRIINHYKIAVKFAKYALKETSPDIILCSLPTIELSWEAVKFGRKKGIPVIIDGRDMWPDIFLDLVPKFGQGFLRLLLFPMFKKVRSVFENATAITGITPAFIEWGLKYANRKRNSLDKDFPLGYTQIAPNEANIKEAYSFWEKYGVNDNCNNFIICFFGTIGQQFNFETVIKAAQKLKGNYPFLFIICGNGDKFTFYRNMAKECENVIFPGWINASQIWALMRLSSVGLAPYINRKDFNVSIPNKVIEYLSAGLPIVSCLNGVLKDLLLRNNCGIYYTNGDPDKLASVLINLYNNPNNLNQMSKNAYELYKGKFIAEVVYSNMAEYLEKITN